MREVRRGEEREEGSAKVMGWGELKGRKVRKVRVKGGEQGKVR